MKERFEAVFWLTLFTLGTLECIRAVKELVHVVLDR
jgi:hypothetical protein